MGGQEWTPSSESIICSCIKNIIIQLSCEIRKSQQRKFRVSRRRLQMKINGKCHCGKITYSAKIDRNAVYLCHCTECQSISGSPFRWAVPVAEENFNLLSGHPKTYIKKVSEDGIESHQLFCPDCASPLYSTNSNPGPKTFNLRLGTAMQRNLLSPKIQYWHRSMQKWVDDIDKVESVESE